MSERIAVKFRKLTADEYKKIYKDKNTFYYVDEKDLYLGIVKLSNTSGEDSSTLPEDILIELEKLKVLTGELKDLETTDKSGLVAAINEIKKQNSPIIRESQTKGMISVNDTDIPIYGLGTAAYKNEDDFVSAQSFTTLSEKIKNLTMAALDSGEVKNGYLTLIDTSGKTLRINTQEAIVWESIKGE